MTAGQMCTWADSSLTSSAMLFLVSSFVFNRCSVLFLSDTFSKEAVVPMCSQRSEVAVTLVASRPEDAHFDLAANFNSRGNIAINSCRS